MFKMDKESLFKEIDIIQNCINRMSQNSFMLKGWALTIIAGTTVLTKGDNFTDITIFVFSVIIPFTCFWLLDAFFLNTELKYRKMYKTILNKRKRSDNNGQFELEPSGYKVENIFKTMISYTLILFYGVPLLTSLVFVIIRFNKM